MEYAAHADPDGYTILLATNAYSVNYGLYNHLPFDPYKDFVGVSELAILAEHVRGQIRVAGKDDEGVRRARPRQRPTNTIARRRRSVPRRKSSSRF